MDENVRGALTAAMASAGGLMARGTVLGATASEDGTMAVLVLARKNDLLVVSPWEGPSTEKGGKREPLKPPKAKRVKVDLKAVREMAEDAVEDAVRRIAAAEGVEVPS